jgi:hypothetical protein
MAGNCRPASPKAFAGFALRRARAYADATVNSSTTLAIDFGVKYIGVALVQHTADVRNRVLYAATIIVESKPLKAIVETRAGSRRIRRTRKTHRGRLGRLSHALVTVPGSPAIVRFCRRRGFGYDAEETDEQAFHISRDEFFRALEAEIEQVISPEYRTYVLSACARHLNRGRRSGAELRPARFENRGRARCNWEGCNHNVPRAQHDIRGRLQQSLFLWLQPVFAASADPVRLRKSVEHWIDELVAASKGLKHVAARSLGSDEAKAAVRPTNTRIKRVYQNLRERVIGEAPGEPSEQFLSNWSEHYRTIVTEIVRGQATGRVRFCQEHSALFVDYVLTGKSIPVEQQLRARDLISRTQQIVFDRLARLVEARLLPLAGGGIDEVVVERVAFDILSGPIKARQSMSPQQASEIYWHGPQAGYGSRREMLTTEFDGHCAYCGQQAALVEAEHILHRGQFPFDSYFNLLPACNACNSRKAGRTALEAQLTVHDAAYEAYCDYLAGRKVLHPYHTIKKGLLNLLRRPGTVERAQQMIGLIADNLVTITNTQRNPRPLARFLATRIATATGNRPNVTHRAARHTALFRGVALPEYDKPADKDAGGLRNHAVDAIMLACDFPSAPALENRQWTCTAQQVDEWLAKVRQTAPALANGLPAVTAPQFIPFFEGDLGDGYCRIDLSAFNCNRRRKAAHKLDPFGKTATGVPTKRIPAAAVLAELRQSEAGRDKQIALIAHRGLRRLLEANPAHASAALVRWLQKSVLAGLRKNELSRHPADVARKRLLASFAAADVAALLSAENSITIPWIIGVKVLNAGPPRAVNVTRSINGNPAAQHYKSEAVIKTLFVGYCQGDGGPDRGRPVLFAVSQIDSVSRSIGQRWQPLDLRPDSPLLGRSLGASEPIASFRQRWQAAFDALLAAEGLVKIFTVTQGCVLEKADGSRFQLRNFDKSEPWMTASTFKNIHRVHRSPLAAMRALS